MKAKPTIRRPLRREADEVRDRLKATKLQLANERKRADQAEAKATAAINAHNKLMVDSAKAGGVYDRWLGREQADRAGGGCSAI